MITLTDSAANHVQSALSRRGKGVGLRLAVKKSGCSGWSYKIEYADEQASNDAARTSAESATSATAGQRFMAGILPSEGTIPRRSLSKGRLANEAFVCPSDKVASAPWLAKLANIPKVWIDSETPPHRAYSISSKIKF